MRFIERDEIFFDICRLEDEILALKKKMVSTGISEKEFEDLKVKQRELRHLKNIRS